MLKKLYRYEFFSLFRSLLPIYAAVIGFSLLSRLTNMFVLQIDTKVTTILSVLINTLYGFSMVAVSVVGLVVIVMRFYKNLLRDEGYLTFSLPFSPTQHIFCKLICGLVVLFIDAIVVLLSLFMLGIGTDFMHELFKLFQNGIHAFVTAYSVKRLVFVAAEVGLTILVAAFQSVLMFYASIAIGQQFKSRIGGAVIAYICFYAAIQTFNSILLSVIFALNFDRMETFFENSLLGFQTALLFPLIEGILLSVVYFVITRHFLTKKLNLE